MTIDPPGQPLQSLPAQDGRSLAPRRAAQELLYAFAIGLALTALGEFQLTHPFFYGPKALKLAMYSIALLIPVLVETMITLARIHVTDGGFLIIAAIVHSLLALLLVRSVMRAPAPRLRRRIASWAIGFAVYLVLGLFFLW